MGKSLISTINDTILYAFNEGLDYFLFQLYCASAAIIIYEPHLDSIQLAIYLFELAFILCYLLTTLLGFLHLWEKRVTIIIIYTICVINLITDITVFKTTNCHFFKEHVELIMGTNIIEGKEFISAYINRFVLTDIFLFILGLLILHLFLKKVHVGILFSRIVGYGSLSLLFITFITTNILKTEDWDVVYYGKIISFLKYTPSPDLSAYRQKPSLSFNPELKTPDNIVIIFGESFSKSHSSLYGYSKATNVHIQTTGINTYYFQNAVSAETGTIPSFKKMLSTLSEDNEGSIDWMDCLTIFDIASKAGFKTEWISNQSRVGMYDNIVAKYGELADTCIWVGTNIGMYKTDYDELLIPHIHPSTNSSEKKLTFIHLLGSHPLYSQRYPDTFAHFTEQDYQESPAHQRQTLSEYDNSILYNDWVVYSIIKKYTTTTSLIIYLSDHGQDIYESSPNFCGHAQKNNPISEMIGKRIPLILFETNKMHDTDSTLFHTITKLDNNRFCNEQLPFVIAYSMGISTIQTDREEYAVTALFNN